MACKDAFQSKAFPVVVGLLALLWVESDAQDCGLRYQWIDPVLDRWFQPAHESATASTQTTEEALEEIRKNMWGEYMPGKEEIILRYNHDTKGVDMEVVRVSKPNQEHKPAGMLKMVRRAVTKHSLQLGSYLADKPKELRFILETEDFPLVRKDWNWKLPSFAMCADDVSIDIPVPDFTFYDYPETHYKNGSWWAVKQLLAFKGYMIGWRDRTRRIFMRHYAGVGPRKQIMPLFIKLQTEGRDEEVLGVKSDVQDTGFVTSNMESFLWLDHWCAYRYLIHTAGFSYSAGLKYKLACGSLVFKFQNQFKEFFEPALVPGVHYVEMSEDASKWDAETAPKIKQTIQQLEAQYGDRQPQIAIEGRNFAMHQLTKDALSCYWYKAIKRYGDLYYS